jgi:hypothetical protein
MQILINYAFGLKFFAANYEEPERSGAQRNLRYNSYCSLTPQQAKKNRARSAKMRLFNGNTINISNFEELKYRRMIKFLTQLGRYFLLLKKVFSKPEKPVLYYKQTSKGTCISGH